MVNNATLIFDFDGTIADTHQYMVGISNRLASEFNYHTITTEEIQVLKDKTSHEIIQHLKVPVMKIPAIIARGKKEYHENITDIQPIEGVKEILHQLKQQGTRIGILSSNTIKNVSTFLENHNLDIFDFIHSTSRVWSKDISLKRLIQKKSLAKESVIYVGDEIRDVAAAKKLGVKTAAVTWGYNSAKSLDQQQPDFLIHTPKELLQFIE